MTITNRMTGPDRGIASAWAITAGLIVAGVTVHRQDVAAAAAFLFVLTWLTLAVVARFRRGALDRAVRRAQLLAVREEQLEQARARWDAGRADRRTTWCPGRPDDAGALPGPALVDFRAFMLGAGAGDLDQP